VALCCDGAYERLLNPAPDAPYERAAAPRDCGNDARDADV
jgi:hypothetical protein